MFLRFGTRAAGILVAALLIVVLMPVSVFAADPPAQLAFGVQPVTAAAGATLAAVKVQVEDAGGNVVSNATSAVTLAFGANPGGGTLGGTLTVDAVNGVATFGDLSIDNAGTGYTLAASSTGLSGAVSTAFNILGPTRLAFGVQPSTTLAGATISPSVTVQVEDANGDVVPASTASVTIGILANPGSGALGGATTLTASAGVATFSNLSIDNAGTGYTLVATSTGLSGATSAAFTITGPPQQLALGVQPVAASAGATLAAVTVQVEDAGGNVVPGATNAVTLGIGSNPGGGTLGGTLTVDAINGVATFNNLSINNAGTGYTLAASSTGLPGAVSTPFNIVGTPAKLAFGVQPTNTMAGNLVSPSVAVQVEDAGGNVVPGATNAVTLGIGSNPGGGTLGGTLTVDAINGVATFNNLSINNAGTGYTLAASSTGLPGAVSTPFNITSSYRLAFGTQPGGGAAGTSWTQQPVVEVVNSLGQVVTSDNSTIVYLGIGSNPAGGTLSCTSGTSLRVTNGVASFYGCSIDIGSSSYYTLSATSSPVWTPATSGAFYVGSAAEQLAFGTQPGGGAAGTSWTQQPVVEVVNSLGQVVTSDNSTIVYLGIGSNPAGGTLSCTSGTSLRVTNGVASFYGCSIDIGSSSYYTLSATSSPVWTPATSGAFYVGSAAEQLAFGTQPGGGAAGTSWTQQPVVEVVNSLGQVVTSDNSTIVYLGIGSNPAGGTLSCTSGTSLRVTNGVASFYGCSIDIGSSSYYTLSATSSPVWTPATSGAFYVGGGRTPVTLTSTIAPGVNRGTSGFGISSQVVARNGYITVLVQTSPNLAGSLVQVWVESKTVGWHDLTLREVAADGTVHYYARVDGWTAYWIKFAGSSTYAPAESHGRIATNPA